MDITFTAGRDVLEKAVSRIISVCERATAEGKNLLPYFFHIRVDGYGSALKLSAGNAVRNIEILIPDVSEHEAFCFGVYGSYFHNILKALPSGDLTFTLRDVCYMHNGASTLKFQILGANQFPAVGIRTDHDWWEVNYRELFSRLKRLVYCVDTQGLINKNYVKAIHISPENFTCTDNRRMSLISNGIIPYNGRILLPAESVSSFSSLFDANSPTGFVYIDGHAMSFSQGNIHASTRLLGYDAPNFESVIPKGPCVVCEADRDAILMAAKRAVIVAKKGLGKESLQPISLTLSTNKMHMNLENQGFGITENIDVKYLGPDLTVHLDLVLLFQAIKNIAGDIIKIEMRGDNAQIIITDHIGDHRNVIMPILLAR